MKIRIIEECWGINRSTGERFTNRTDDQLADAVEGTVIEMPTGRRRFTVDAVGENSVTVSVCPQNNSSVRKTLEVTKGENVSHRPRGMDGGYKYLLTCED